MAARKVLLTLAGISAMYGSARYVSSILYNVFLAKRTKVFTSGSFQAKSTI